MDDPVQYFMIDRSINFVNFDSIMFFSNMVRGTFTIKRCMYYLENIKQVYSHKIIQNAVII